MRRMTEGFKYVTRVHAAFGLAGYVPLHTGRYLKALSDWSPSSPTFLQMPANFSAQTSTWLQRTKRPHQLRVFHMKRISDTSTHFILLHPNAAV